MIPIFIGLDRVETVAYHVFSHSIIRRSSLPVSITPIYKPNLGGEYWRPRGEFDSNEFSNSRWIVPHLMDFKGWAIWADCDMLCLDDIAKLWDQRDSRYAVMVKKHNHAPSEDVKFLGQQQTQYDRKNWSSLVLFNCSEGRNLTKVAVNTSPGLWMHQFRWLDDEQIGSIKGDWNLLVGYDPVVERPSLVHYTSMGPWHDPNGDTRIDYRHEWESEYLDMIEGDNPVRWIGAKKASIRAAS
jgi:hypothetical protein